MACHNCTPCPKFISFDLRVAVAMTVQSFSLFVTAIEAQKVKEASITSEPARQRILKVLEEGRRLRAALASPQSNIIDVLDCRGAAVVFGGKVHRFGTAPTAKQIQSLVEYVGAECKGWLCTADLSQVWNGALGFSQPRIGCLAHCNKVISVADQVCMLWFRMPTDVDMEFGEDPASAHTGADNFSRCLQSSVTPPEPWSDGEQDVARKLLGDLGLKNNEPEDNSSTDLPADRPNESNSEAEQGSPSPVVNGKAGPATHVNAWESNKPSRPSSRSMDQALDGTTDDSVSKGSCWPIRKLFFRKKPAQPL